VFTESWHFWPPSFFGASPLDLPQSDTENRVLLPVLGNRSHRLLPPQESTRQQVLGATSSRPIARDSTLTRDSAASCSLDVCQGKSTLSTVFQAARRASCSRRGRTPVLTWLCLFFLALRASLPAGLNKGRGRLLAALRQEHSASARTAIKAGSRLPSSGGIQRLLEDKGHGRGAEAQLSTHTLPAASPAPRRVDKHTHAGNPPSTASHPGETAPIDAANCPERLFKDRLRPRF